MDLTSNIYTLGTSTRSEEEFLDLLKHYHIKTVVDVRSFPKSRFEHFIGENLQRTLKEQGFDYIYLGKDLGGFRKGGYLAYMETAPYKEGISKMEEIGKKSAIAFICAERFPWKCHRRFIASSLGNRGWKVVHIIDKEKVWTPKPMK